MRVLEAQTREGIAQLLFCWGRRGQLPVTVWSIRERAFPQEGSMAEIERISVGDARREVQSKTALLVCAYADEAKFNSARLEGAIPLAGLTARAATLPKGQEIIFYCG